MSGLVLERQNRLQKQLGESITVTHLITHEREKLLITECVLDDRIIVILQLNNLI